MRSTRDSGGPTRIGSDERHTRHLQLVTDEWLAELAKQRTVLPFTPRGPLGRHRAPRAEEGQGDTVPLRPA